MNLPSSKHLIALAAVLGAASAFAWKRHRAQAFVDVRAASDIGAVVEYDAAIVASYVQPKKLYELEPRDPTWASATEAWLARRLSDDVARSKLGVEVTSVSCKLASCRVTWTGPDQEGARFEAFLRLFYPSGTSTSQKGKMFMVYGAEMGRTTDEIRAAFERKRAQKIALVRSGKEKLKGAAATLTIPEV